MSKVQMSMLPVCFAGKVEQSYFGPKSTPRECIGVRHMPKWAPCYTYACGVNKYSI